MRSCRCSPVAALVPSPPRRVTCWSCEEPVGQRCPRFLKRRAYAWVNAVGAMLARIGAPLGDAMELGVRAARGAGEFAPAVAHVHDLVEASRIVRVFVFELLERVAHLQPMKEAEVVKRTDEARVRQQRSLPLRDGGCFDSGEQCVLRVVSQGPYMDSILFYQRCLAELERRQQQGLSPPPLSEILAL
jgi:hypothetical protein